MGTFPTVRLRRTRQNETLRSLVRETHRAGFAGVVCVYLDGHRPLQERLVGNRAVQFGKAPFGVGGIGTALLVRSLFASASLGPFSDMGQIFQTDEALWVLVYDAFGDHMIGVLLQPSLSSDKRDESPINPDMVREVCANSSPQLEAGDSLARLLTIDCSAIL